MSELKPCPFCGGEPDEYEGEYGNGIYCMKCGAMVGELIHLGFNIAERVSYEQAAKAWNTRAERTCRMTDRGECSECGAYIVRAWTEVHDFNGDMKRIDLRSHNYCPNCGARVTPKDSETTPKVVSE